MKMKPIQLIKDSMAQILVKTLAQEKSKLYLDDEMLLSRQDIKDITNKAHPYFETKEIKSISDRDDIIIMTSRFRSGSTALWNIFRQLPNCTSYYEPFNERRWFDSSERGGYVDGTHIGVSDYWQEYEGLDYLGQWYNRDWIVKGLFMDKYSHNPAMHEYINQLINKSNGRPALQFNRIDFRLPWLRRIFPNAKFVHQYRHPRDQWLSFLTNKLTCTPDNVSTHYKDQFYLYSWCDDLRKHFPFLDRRTTTHPYALFYYLWKLSYLYGQKYCDISISLEDLCQQSGPTLEKLFDELKIDKSHIEIASEIIAKPSFGKWQKWAEQSWFEGIEEKCEHTLSQFFAMNN